MNAAEKDQTVAPAGVAANDGLPFIDSHSIAVIAAPERAWDETARLMRCWEQELLPRFAAGAVPRFARLLRCPYVNSPGPGAEMPAAIVGFRVVEAERPSRIVLAGEHRFSRYVLCFEVDVTADAGCDVRAETRASFPGRLGSSYRVAVIGSGAHIRVVGRMLSLIKVRAEAG